MATSTRLPAQPAPTCPCRPPLPPTPTHTRPHACPPSPFPPSVRTIAYLYDGDCSMCNALVAMLKRADEGRGLIKFVNIASMAYNPAENEGEGLVLGY